MFSLIDYAISHARLTIVTLAFLMLAGFTAYVTIPKEAEPDIKIPIVYVQLTQRGISPEDSERLLLRPVETQLKSVGNVKEMRSTAYEGGGYVLLEFQAGFDSKSALADVRAKVDQAKRDLPKDADEPAVQEVNLSLYPVLVVALSGEVPERTMLQIARNAKNAIEQVPGVLAGELRGARDEAVEIIAEPMLLKSYGVSLEQLMAGVGSSNSLIAAGALEGSTGRFAVKVPSLIEKPQDVLKIPMAAANGAAVTIGDVVRIKPTFKDATSVTRVNGLPAMTIEVSKRTGANLIETVDGVKKVVETLQKTWPTAVQVTFTQDKSKVIRQMLSDLQNSVATGVLLVAVIILFALGFRASLFIGIAIPASFLAGVLGLQLAGLTVNIVVLFSLILAVGMLVDDAIIVSEFAERRMAEGMPPREAYSLAAKRMSGPVIAATATRVAAFSPLLFWPGVVGEFMKYLPITLIATLSASLAVALFFTPTLGALLGRASANPHDERSKADGLYMRTVRFALRRPGATLALTALLLVVVQVGYGKFGRGVEFFPAVEPDYGQVIVHGRGNLALDEKNRFLADVEKRVLAAPGLKTVYTRVGEQPRGSQEISEDTIGVIQFEFADWRTRAPGHAIMDGIRAATADIPGVLVEVTAPRAGPPTGKPVQVQLGALDPEALPAAARKVAASPCQASGNSGPRRRPAAARHRLEDLRRQGRGREIRRQPRDRRQRAAACHQRREGDRIPAVAHRQVGGHPGALSRGPQKPRPDRRVARADGVRLGAARQFRRTQGLAARRLHQPHRRQPRDDGLRQRRAGRADREGAGSHRKGTRAGRSRPGRDLEAQGRGRGAGEGRRVPDEGVRHRDLPDLCDPARAVQPADFGRAGSLRRAAVHHRRAAGPAGDGPAVRRGDDRHRRDRQRGRHRQQQHRADRHLRPAAPGRLGGLRGNHRDLPRARPSGGADGGDRDPRRAADRIRRQHRVPDPRGLGRRAGDAMVDQPLDRHRVRAWALRPS